MSLAADARAVTTAPFTPRASGGEDEDVVTAGGARGAAPDAPGYFERKVLHFSYAPEADVVAVAGRNNLFIYGAVAPAVGAPAF